MYNIKSLHKKKNASQQIYVNYCLISKKLIFKTLKEKRSIFMWPIMRAKEKGSRFTLQPHVCRVAVGALINPGL